MKDYSLDFKHAKTFILNYTVNDGKITVNFADGDSYTIPCTEENEKKLLEKMKEQVNLSDSFREDKLNKLNDANNSIFSGVFGLFLSIVGIAINSICGVFFVSFFLALLICTVKRKKVIKEIIKDIDKNKMFVANEQVLNETLKENGNILANVDEEIKDLVLPISKEKPVFTLNNIDAIDYEQLEQIIDNVNIEEKFEFDYMYFSEDQGVIYKKRLKKDQ